MTQALLKDHAEFRSEVTRLGQRAKSPPVSFPYLSFFWSLPTVGKFSMPSVPFSEQVNEVDHWSSNVIIPGNKKEHSGSKQKQNKGN
jgi:hypothetical protein